MSNNEGIVLFETCPYNDSAAEQQEEYSKSLPSDCFCGKSNEVFMISCEELSSFYMYSAVA